MVRHLPALSIAMSVTSLALLFAQPSCAETVTIGIGTQDTTTNTVTAGTVVRQLHLLEKYLPTTGKYANIVTDGGKRMFVGDVVDGYKLVSVDKSKLVFTGKLRIEFAW